MTAEEVHELFKDAHGRLEDLLKIHQIGASTYEATIDRFAEAAMTALIARADKDDLNDIVKQREIVASAFHFAKFAVSEKTEMFRQEGEAVAEAGEKP